MTISRAQMASQLTGSKMKKTKKMKEGGKLLNMLSPAAALFNTIRSGEPQGLMKLSPLAHALRRSKRSDDADPMLEKTSEADDMALATRPTRPTRGMSRGMKGGGKVRGDGICQRGRTKGRFV
jgi:hypothetical protein